MGRKFLRRLFVLSGLFLLPSWAAFACTCPAGLLYSLPKDETVGVPTNVVIILAFVDDPPPELVLTDATGRGLPLSRTVFQSGSLYLLELEPGASLLGNTAYTLSAGSGKLIRFTTAEIADTAPPAALTSLSLAGRFEDGYANGAYGSCGESTTVEISYGSSSDNMTAPSDLLYRVYVGQAGVVDTTSASVLLAPEMLLGQTLCLSTWEGFGIGDAVTIRVAVRDAAGNESSLSSSATGIINDDLDRAPREILQSGGGLLACSVIEGVSKPALGAYVWIALFGLMLRRAWQADRSNP